MGRGRPESKEGAQLKRYAARMGLCLKTARAHRERGEASWKEFCAGEAGVEGSPVQGTVARLEKVQADAWRQYLQLVAQYDRAVDTHSGPDTLGKYERAVKSAQERYEAASLAVSRAQTEAGMLIPYERVQAFLVALEPLGELYDSLKDLIGARMKNTDAEAIFYRAFEETADEWDALIGELNGKIKAVLPCF